MEKKEYSVSEAVRLIGVESHVLRYWEEELQVEIRRTSQGHRIYSQENIETFCMVKELKEYGLQLKAIRYLLEKTGETKAKAKLTEQIFEIGGAAAKKKEETPGGSGKRETEEVRDSSRENVQREKGGGGSSWEEEQRKRGSEGLSRADEEEQFAEEETGQYDEKSSEIPPIEEEDENITYDIAIIPVPEEDFDRFRQFEEILKRIIGEIIEEKNQKMELSFRKVLREELDEFFLLYQDIASEAAAEREEKSARKGFFEYLRDFWRR